MDMLRSLLGLLVLLLIAWAFSTDRRRIRWRTVAWGTGLQLAFAVLILKTAPGEWLFRLCGEHRDQHPARIPV
jgi:CNT family concentrative nucleoside transporter